MWQFVISLFWFVAVTTGTGIESLVCEKYSLPAAAATTALPQCPQTIIGRNNTIYLLYDVNAQEGFNLRRDVYIRLAVFARRLQKRRAYANVRLVLPPWRRLYHWKSSHLQQENLPWSTFFDVESLRRYAPVLDFPEFLEDVAQFGLHEMPFVPVDRVLQLMQFEEMFDDGVFRDKFELQIDCPKEQHLRGHLLQQPVLLENDFLCVRFQGSASLLERVLRLSLHSKASSMSADPKVLAVLNAEILLHDHWGDRQFWRARRSMRFAAPLIKIATNFRRAHLDWSDMYDMVQRPPMWEEERPHYRSAVGGNYLCVHLRRGDFVHGREKTTPTLKSAATQIKQCMYELNLTTVFLASDATAFELTNLRAYLQRVQVVRFGAESLQQKAQIKDGGIAIIDQLICAHARHFIGTYESTFTYRIYEEREIMGFPKSATFNTLCKSESLLDCPKNSVWPIVY